jgi:tripartite-type tricarboxylate transporter receptor subunit TctC
MKNCCRCDPRGSSTIAVRLAGLSLWVSFLAMTFAGAPNFGYAAAPYYEGKTVTIVVGYKPGGGYDRYARLYAKYLPKHIPGSPAVIVQNMPTR